MIYWSAGAYWATIFFISANISPAKKQRNSVIAINSPVFILSFIFNTEPTKVPKATPIKQPTRQRESRGQRCVPRDIFKTKAKNMDKQLRSIMQEQTGINYIFLGSQESMMTDIFERVKSPFYHFGMLMRLNKIPYEDFKSYIADRLEDVSEQAAQIADEILTFTSCHPYYTQQLSFAVWNNLVAGKNEDVLQLAVEDIITTHDLDYERLWLNFNKTDKYVMVSICEGNNPAQDRNQPTSTMTSALLRLSKKGYIFRSDRYEIEDPFFRKWILKNMIE